MSTVNELITELTRVKKDIRQALINKDVSMDGVPFTQYASKINELGGGRTRKLS